MKSQVLGRGEARGDEDIILPVIAQMDKYKAGFTRRNFFDSSVMETAIFNLS